MIQEKIAALNALGPVELGTIGALVASLLLATVLSVVIERRGARRPIGGGTLTRAQVMATPRRTAPSAPVDMQERLRRLTAGAGPAADVGVSVGLGAGAGDRVSAPTGDGVAVFAPGSAAPGPVAPAPDAVSRPTPSDDATRFFGGGPAADGSDGVADADATTFFAGPDAQADHGDHGDHGDDATRFFSDAATPDATTFFGEEPAPAHAASPERDDATRFFGADDPEGLAAEDHDRTSFLPPSETHFFAPEELQGGADGHTGMLHALPPATNATKAGMWDTATESPATGDTGSLTRVRECLAGVSVPEVMALSVIDGAGRVLAGETDADLTGELRSLMAESGQGNTADIDQPVRLADDATGAILLLPTGANALLGALVRDADDPEATRQSLRAVAHNIGDAIRRAS